MVAKWYCRMMGSEMGPYSATELVDLARQKRLTPEDWVRKGSDGPWVSAYRVHGLFEAASQPASGSTPALSAASSVTASLTTESHAAAPAPAATSVKRHASDIEWFCISRGEKLGPMSFQELRSLANQGKVDPKARVWSTTAPKWCRATEIPGLIR
jgi:hypothetical protein